MENKEQIENKKAKTAFIDEKEYMKIQYEALNYSNQQFDKHIFLISSGALGVSFTFIEKIVDLKIAIYSQFLIVSWSLFALVIFISLLMHFFSAKAITWSIINYENTTDFVEKQMKRNKPVHAGNFITVGLLFLGILSLFLFINFNLNNNMNNKEKAQSKNSPKHYIGDKDIKIKGSVPIPPRTISDTVEKPTEKPSEGDKK